MRFLAVLVLPLPLLAQDHLLRFEPCSCTIRLEHVTTFGKSDDFPVGAAYSIRRLRTTYYFSHDANPTQITVFGADGSGLRHLGRSGDGPGEYRGIADIEVDDRGYLHVFDASGRYTILDSNGEVHRIERMPLRVRKGQVLLLADGRYIANAVTFAPHTIGLPLHLVDRSRLVRSFGAESEEFLPGDQVRLWRSLAADTGGRFWAGWRNAYTLELWDTTGVLQRRLRRDAPWAPFWNDYRTPTPQRPPLSMLYAVMRDSAGRLWTFTSVPDPDYAGSLEAVMGETGSHYYKASAIDRLYDTRIEVIDPARSIVLASRQVPEFIPGIIDSQHVYSYREVDGIPLIDVWRVHIVDAN